MEANLDSIIKAHDDLRDHMAVHSVMTLNKQLDLYDMVALQTSLFCFNTYKTIGIIIRERYYEQAAVMLRILWEAALNLAWVSEDPTHRSKLFCQFTVVEKRKFLVFKLAEARRLKDVEALEVAERNLLEFEGAYADVLKDYRFQDKKGKKRLRSRVTGPSIEEAASDLGGHWAKEYREVYPLLSIYAHATPGAILFPNSPDGPLTDERFQEEDAERTKMVALWSMALVERVYVLLRPLLDDYDSDYFDSLNADFNFRGSLA